MVEVIVLLYQVNYRQVCYKSVHVCTCTETHSMTKMCLAHVQQLIKAISNKGLLSSWAVSVYNDIPMFRLNIQETNECFG